MTLASLSAWWNSVCVRAPTRRTGSDRHRKLSSTWQNTNTCTYKPFSYHERRTHVRVEELHGERSCGGDPLALELLDPPREAGEV